MSIKKPDSLPLLPLAYNRSGSFTRVNSIASTAPSQPAIDEVARTPRARPSALQNVAAYKNVAKHAAIGVATMAAVAGFGFGAKAVFDKISDDGNKLYSLNQGRYCSQFETFSWVVPNFEGAKVTGRDTYAGYLEGNYVDFHNQPQNLKDICMQTFGRRTPVFNPNPTGMTELDLFGPFPGANGWLQVGPEHSTMGEAPKDVQLVWWKGQSNFDPKAKA